MTALEVAPSGVTIDYDAVLKALNLNARDPKTQALLLVCDRYGLDPVLKHIVLISGNAYVTRDGYLAVAHRSGVFNGMEVLDQGETETHFTARVAVHRKDMTVPFVFNGRFPKNKNMAKEYGPEMAIKVAEVQALRRAFNVTGLSSADERWAEMGDKEPAPAPMLTRSQIVRPPPGLPKASPETGEIIDVKPEAAPIDVVATDKKPAPKGKPDAPATVKTLNAIRKLVKGPDDEVAAKCAEVLGREVNDLFELTEVEAATACAAIESEF